MVAEMVPTHQDDEVIDLDAMTADELIAERALVWSEIQHIEAQLADPMRIYDLGADEYVVWRKRAVWALRYCKIDLRNVGDALMARRLANLRESEERKRAEKEAERAAQKEQARLNRLANGWDPNAPKKTPKVTPSTPAVSPEELERRRQRRADVVVALQGNGGTDGLLLRMAVVLHHLTGGGDLPIDFPEECRQTLGDLSVYLKHRYGDGPVSAARAGRLTADTVIDTDDAP